MREPMEALATRTWRGTMLGGAGEDTAIVMGAVEVEVDMARFQGRVQGASGGVREVRVGGANVCSSLYKRQR